jgi:hypothetical protein
MFFGAEHGRLLPAAALLGGTYLMTVDLLGRVIFAPGEINIGVLTAILGAPFSRRAPWSLSWAPTAAARRPACAHVTARSSRWAATSGWTEAMSGL